MDDQLYLVSVVKQNWVRYFVRQLRPAERVARYRYRGVRGYAPALKSASIELGEPRLGFAANRAASWNAACPSCSTGCCGYACLASTVPVRMYVCTGEVTSLQWPESLCRLR